MFDVSSLPPPPPLPAAAAAPRAAAFSLAILSRSAFRASTSALVARLRGMTGLSFLGSVMSLVPLVVVVVAVVVLAVATTTSSASLSFSSVLGLVGLEAGGLAAAGALGRGFLLGAVLPLALSYVLVKESRESE